MLVVSLLLLVCCAVVARSMHYPALQDMHIDNLNKIGFASLASAAIMNLMKRQRDSVGMSIYSDR